MVVADQGVVTPLANVGWWGQINEFAAGAGARVLLTGEFGNYALSAGGLPVLREWIRRRQWLRWLAEARSAMRRGDVRMRGVLFMTFSPWLPGSAADFLIRRLLEGAAADDRFNFLRAEFLPCSPPPRPFPQPARGHFAGDLLEILKTLDPGQTRKGSLARFGISERAPAAGRRLVKFCLRLSPEHLLHKGEFKPLARAALSDRLPADLLNQKQRGIQGTDWPLRFSADDAQAAMEEVQANSDACELINMKKLRAAIDRWPKPGALHEPQLASFGLNVSTALTVGIFLRELQMNPESFGRGGSSLPQDHN
jgi:hypothetical protein